ncbi:DUF2213 domain-containing protein [Sphingomonas sp. ABOLF]|uniref:DUF2213 domain-containing protein n=1 Tax=Sphingomonas sp. ABOLF TaxID=1985879 RepID=UPI000F7EE7C8|nr:DUF2213 domain-containing protein [Sphingomonas sp. ABOLF]RSV15674.1 DUF2213 domain-containing protein [Sphingomonas sp. ABOLF]
MLLADRLTLDAPRRTADGYLAVRAKSARTGVYQYTGAEVDPENKHGLRDQPSVNVLRDEAAVFDKRAVHSFIGKPITDDHPREAVTASNWRDHGRGVVMGAIRDGDHLAFDLILMDAGTIAKVEAGKAELSNGYSASLEFGDFDGPGGVKCQARQASITGNHVAIVDRGRAGPSCRIGDAAICDALPIALEDGAKEAAAWLKKAIALHEKHMNGSAPTTGKEGEKSQMLMMEQMKNALAELEGGGMKSGMKMDCYPFHIHDQEKPVKTMLIDGLTVDMANADTAIATVQTLLAARDTATGKVTALETQVATKDAEIARLTAENKTLTDAKPTPSQLRDAAKQFAMVADKAKAVGVTVTDAMDEAAIMKAVVDAKLGATAASYTADQISVAFDVLTKDAKPATATVQPIVAPQLQDAATAEQQAWAGSTDFNAWRTAKSAA